MFTVSRLLPRFTAFLAAATLLAVAPIAALAADEEEDTPLAKEMSAMNKSYRALKKQIADASKKDTSIELVQAMKKSAVASKEFIPARVKDIPENEKAKFNESYMTSVDGLIAHFDKLEKALADGKADEAKTLFDEINTLKRKGHEEFQAEEDAAAGDKGH